MWSFLIKNYHDNLMSYQDIRRESNEIEYRKPIVSICWSRLSCWCFCQWKSWVFSCLCNTDNSTYIRFFCYVLYFTIQHYYRFFHSSYPMGFIHLFNTEIYYLQTEKKRRAKKIFKLIKQLFI